MNEWGWNPITVQAIGSWLTLFALIGAVIAAISSWRASNSAQRTALAAESSAETVQREFQLRSRPWVWISNIITGQALPGQMPLYNCFVTLICQNSGIVPASGIRIELAAFPDRDFVGGGIDPTLVE